MTIRYQYPEKDPFWQKTFSERMEYFDDDTLANEWLENLVKKINWDLFEDGSWLYSINEVEKGRNPKIKDDVFFEKIKYFFDKETVFLRQAIITYVLRTILHEDVDLDDESIAWLLDEGYGDELVDFRQLIPKWLKEDSGKKE